MPTIQNTEYRIKEPLVRCGCNFACANICTFLGLWQIFADLKGFFLTRCAKKSLVELQKFVTSQGICRYWHMQNFSQIVQPCYSSWAKSQGSGPKHREALWSIVWSNWGMGEWFWGSDSSLIFMKATGLLRFYFALRVRKMVNKLNYRALVPDKPVSWE